MNTEQYAKRLGMIEVLQRQSTRSLLNYLSNDTIKLIQKEVKIEKFMDTLNDTIAEAEVSHPAGYGCGTHVAYDEDFIRKELTNLVNELQ